MVWLVFTISPDMLFLGLFIVHGNLWFSLSENGLLRLLSRDEIDVWFTAATSEVTMSLHGTLRLLSRDGIDLWFIAATSEVTMILHGTLRLLSRDGIDVLFTNSNLRDHYESVPSMCGTAVCPHNIIRSHFRTNLPVCFTITSEVTTGCGR